MFVWRFFSHTSILLFSLDFSHEELFVSEKSVLAFTKSFCFFYLLFVFCWVQLEKEKCPPGKYYPFVSGKIKVLCVCMCKSICMYTYIYIHASIHIQMYTYINTCIYTHAHLLSLCVYFIPTVFLNVNQCFVYIYYTYICTYALYVYK